MGELTSDELSDLHGSCGGGKLRGSSGSGIFEEEHPARKIRKLHKRGLESHCLPP